MKDFFKKLAGGILFAFLSFTYLISAFNASFDAFFIGGSILVGASTFGFILSGKD